MNGMDEVLSYVQELCDMHKEELEHYQDVKKKRGGLSEASQEFMWKAANDLVNCNRLLSMVQKEKRRVRLRQASPVKDRGHKGVGNRLTVILHNSKP